MFKKLKEKITEEVKISPQRFQQLSQSVTDRLQNSSTSDENFFSIGEDDANMSNTSLEPGFSNVSLTSPQEPRIRRSSNSSLASDVSFLPRYESLHNMYHLQSDLDASASEMEDNASTSSSQLGHLSKEQIYSAFQKAQMRYHKYRGRYTDLAKHYKDLERENTKMKSVLVDTQDKAIRRVTELKEQCGLEQKAKAHLEAALRDEIDEKQLKIESLQTKVGLLQNGHNNQDTETLDTLNKYLTDARSEIESLNLRLHEMKANAIIFQTKEQEYKLKISGLEKEISLFSEREKENNLTLAQNKMELHNELLSKDAEMSKLKQDNETLRQNLDTLNNGNLKMDNLQIQNKKLIDKLENLTQKCNTYENELLRMEQYKIELQTSNHTNSELRNSLKEVEQRLDEVREDAKNSLLNLEVKIRENIRQEFEEKEGKIRQEFQKKFEEVSANADNLQTIQLGLIQKDDEIKRLSEENERNQEELSAKSVKYSDLESTHLELIEECSDLRNSLIKLKKEVLTIQQSLEEKNFKIEILEKEYQLLLDRKDVFSQEDVTKNQEIERLKSLITETETQLKASNESLREKIQMQENELCKKIQVEEKYQRDLEDNIKQLNIKNEKIQDLQDQLANFEKETSLLKRKCEENSKETNTLNTTHLLLIDEMKNLKVELENRHELLEKCQKQIITLNEEIHKNQLKEEYNQSLVQKCQQLEENLKEAQQKLEVENKNKEELKVLITNNYKLKEEIEIISKEKQSIELSKQEEIDKNTYVMKDLENNNNKLIEEMENIIKEKKSIELSKVNLEEKIETLSSELSQQRNSSEENHKEMSVLLEQINSLEKLLEEAHNNCAIREHDLSRIGEDYSLEKLKVIELSKNIDELTNKVEKFESEINLKNQQIEIFSRKIDDFNQLCQERNNDLLEILHKVLDEPINNLKRDSDNKKLLNIEEKLHHFEKTFSLEKENLAKHLSHLTQFHDRYNALVGENTELVRQVQELQSQLYELNSLKQIEAELVRVKEENRCLNEENDKTRQDIIELQSQNAKVTADSNYISDENQLLMTELEDLKLKNEDLKVQLNNTKLEINTQKSEISVLNKQLDGLSNHESQLKELEKHIEELQYEKQLFQDEIQELKTVPINLQNHKLEDPKIYAQEIENLRLKVTQYKSLDLTNKSSIEFYENELQKLKNQNEKLNRKLDETLVTLNHCTELSNSTEIEYLKNVLYNYMLGKESLVLARVIAAVCKFDPNQTETILAKEQQKQTLLGQLGIL